ncbi:acyltransferase [Amycolatopsis pithecellobii]|uniref:Acyltransferase n=1 Tax=Amycolatopsis pithecellobii TaxID=664692 RepID=A0A6N7YRH5_9PSEU|nr:acyltransferase [Amycolatopsis pithecellobii]MTD54508.1 acyltransferase [Amycolatopsis pithecellobii]
MTGRPTQLSPLHIVGAGGLGREALDAAFACGYRPSGLVLIDDHLSVKKLHGVAVRRPEEARSGAYVVAVADPLLRRSLSERMLGRGLIPSLLVHPAATIGHDTSLAGGCIVLANTYVATGAQLSAHTQVQAGSTIGHDSVLHDYVTVLPGADVAGRVVLHGDVTVGHGARVLPGLVIGPSTCVEAGEVVTHSRLGKAALTRVRPPAAPG